MNIYLISVNSGGYDTFDSAVVAAPSAKAARNIHPMGPPYVVTEEQQDGSWVTDPALVSVQLIGKAGPNVAAGVICASFNAG